MSCDSQLLILGNGFDLQCGLKSGFDDFMKTRLDKIKTIHKIIEAENIEPDTYKNLIRVHGIQTVRDRNLFHWYWKNELTVWDFILYEDKRQRTWYDIEDCIRKWVDFRPDSGNPGCEPLIKQVHSDYLSFKNLSSRYTFWTNWDKTPNKRISRTTEEVILIYALQYYGCSEEMGSLLRMFLYELNRYERVFATYLQEQLDEDQEYSDLATVLLLNLINDQVPQPALTANPRRQLYTSNPESIGILNFNYTDPRKDDWEGQPEALNIHGLAGKGGIIFGIDGTNLSAGQNYYADIVKFTKTYRLMEFSGRPHQSLIHPYLPNSTEGATGMIKFFGHSLGDADYSYFQAIFDEVNLYESNTHLIFYYNEERRHQKKNWRTQGLAKQEMFEKVNRLIATYGRTLENEDHGKNLLHKLLLEGRLTIKQAPTYRIPAYFQND